MRLNLRRFDFVLLGTTILLMIFGVAMVYSATLDVPGYEDYALRQAIYGLVGLVLLIAVAAFDYRLLTSLQWPIYGVILVVLAAVAALGQVRGGSSGCLPWPSPSFLAATTTACGGHRWCWARSCYWVCRRR
jgi:cell division protein FtsW (lipid II flippase)